MTNRSPRRALLLAAAASFLVYLLPVVTPHTFWVVGEVAVRDLGRLVGGGERWLRVVAAARRLGAMLLGSRGGTLALAPRNCQRSIGDGPSGECE